MERVVSVRSGNQQSDRRVLRAFLERLGDGKQLRGLSQRDADSVLRLLDPARLGFASVSQHQCLHDQGQGNCS